MMVWLVRDFRAGGRLGSIRRPNPLTDQLTYFVEVAPHVHRIVETSVESMENELKL